MSIGLRLAATKTPDRQKFFGSFFQKRTASFLALLLTAAAPENWPNAGNDTNGTYFSPLTSINTANASRLGFAWQYDLGTQRGQQATPLVVDGVMYSAGTWGYVYAVDAATGRELWRFDPHVNGQVGRNPCCDIVNRGVALWQNRVYVASLDGMVHALDAATGRQIWQADSITDHHMPYASTGAPIIAHDVMIIGNAGADMDHGGVRGYVSAYDLRSGALKWRVFTVPPAPGRKPETPALAEAAKTWSPARDPGLQGGGTAWDGLSYDPTLNMVYVGTGNGAPYDARALGAGDHLFVASILALDADTGKMAWHYQTTPRDHWDFDAVQKFILADLPIDGTMRHVLMQANKNGFFYVLDAATGALISARDFTLVTWAKSIDLKTGRPVLADQGDYFTGPKNIYPSWAGGHSWPPMSFDAVTKLVYIPVIDAPSVWVDLSHARSAVKYSNGFFGTPSFIPDDTYDAASVASLFGPLPDLAALQATRKTKLVRELLRAWDPVAQSTVWEVETSSGLRGYDGGVLSTAGNLVIQGRGTGELWIYAADTGRVLKTIQTGSHIMAAPMTYMVHGVQYVAVQVGYGGTAMAVGAIPSRSAAMRYENVNRILAFRLDGGAVPLPPARQDPPFPKPPPQTATPAQIRLGEIKFTEQCARCHVFGPSITPDLRKLSPETHSAFKDIVLHGMYASMGMGRFDDVLTDADADALHAYLIDQSWAAYRP